MVKNAGGNKAKKQARKTVSGLNTPTQNVRYTAEPGETYAVIEKIYGGKTCQVMCEDGVSRRCTIRRKFTAARKGENAIAPGTWIMAGLYDWEKRADGTQNCDMLEVYSSGEREKLKQTVNAKVLKHIITVNNTFDGNANGTEFIFSETLANIDDERSQEEESGQDSGEEPEQVEEDAADREILLAAERLYPTKKPLLVVRETVAEVMDMMRINVDDI
jgi:translation initiation factor IF-1